MNSGDFSRELVYMLLMSPAAYLALGVEMVLLMCILVVSIPDTSTDVSVLPCCNLSPPAVIRHQSCSSFWGR